VLSKPAQQKTDLFLQFQHSLRRRSQAKRRERRGKITCSVYAI